MATAAHERVSGIKTIVGMAENSAKPAPISNGRCTPGERTVHYGFNAVVAITGLLASVVIFALASRCEIVGLAATAIVLSVWCAFAKRRTRSA